VKMALSLSLKTFDAEFVVNDKCPVEIFNDQWDGKMVDPRMKVGTWQGKTVMVKFDHPHSAAELEVYRKIGDHPNILPLLAVAENGKRMVYEYPSGGSLENWMGKLKATEVQPLLLQTAKTLEFLHSKGFVHRNLKPSYIYFTQANHIKIGGLYCSAHPSPYYCSPRFAAPEQLTRFLDGVMSPATDVFTFAMCIPYFYGVKYWVNPMERNSFSSDDYARAQSPDSLTGTVPQHLIELMHRCLKLHPDQRCSLANVISTLETNINTR